VTVRPDPSLPIPARPDGSPTEVFLAFLVLGLTAFGGPVAHLGYFREAFVVRRRWLDEEAYADLVALCQFLPGPASSQVGFVLGWRRAGFPGAMAAWSAFTLPSALLLVLVAAGADALAGPAGAGLLHGLKLAAVAVVAQAVWSMARTLTPDPTRAGIAAAALVTLTTGPAGQVAAIAGGALAGMWLCRAGLSAPAAALRCPISRRTGVVALALFVALPVLAALAALTGSPAAALFGAVYRAGALVFGGGHVVLPLLEAEVVRPGWIGADAFLAGYGAAQAVPGPLFTVAAYLGALAAPGPGGIAGAALCLAAIFLPGLLLVTGVLPFWEGLRDRPGMRMALRGANAAVVGLLAAALWHPLGTGAILAPTDFAVALAGVAALTVAGTPPWLVVGASALAGLMLG